MNQENPLERLDDECWDVLRVLGANEAKGLSLRAICRKLRYNTPKAKSRIKRLVEFGLARKDKTGTPVYATENGTNALLDEEVIKQHSRNKDILEIAVHNPKTDDVTNSEKPVSPLDEILDENDAIDYRKLWLERDQKIRELHA